MTTQTPFLTPGTEGDRSGVRSATASPRPGKSGARAAAPVTEYTVAIIGYSTPPLSLNRRLHWAAEAEVKKNLKWSVACSIAQAKVPKDMARVEVELHWRPTTKRDRDVDNPSPTLKVCLDAMTAKGVIRDDNSSVVVSARCVIEEPRRPAALWLTIRRLP